MHDVLELWGKTADGERYHPAIFHMLDVGHVAWALLGPDGSPRIASVLRHAWRGANVDALLEWLPFLVALHDIGKIAAPFQGQQSTPAARRQHDRLVRAGLQLPVRQATKAIPHNAISALFLNTRLTEQRVHRNTIAAIRDAASGHHGFFMDDLQDAKDALLLANEAPVWEQLRRGGYDLLHEKLAPAGSLTDIGKPSALRSATIALTGLIVLADWIGSNTEFFPTNCEDELDVYVVESRKCAAAAIRKAGFTTNRAAPTYSNVAALFPEINNDPRPLQQGIDVLTPDALAGPTLYVIEAPTGEGKTEAALALARRLAAAGQSDELFFALPTMATGNQMFGRLSKLYDRLYGADGAVKLLHGQAALVETDLRRMALHDPDNDSDAVSQHWAASGAEMLRWFGTSKRALLAPFGVGTVDQVELAGLHTRYYMLKLFSLAGKVVVIDEVHAYDAYMNTILEHTLQWLAALGTSVILLSATLPAARHAALATAFVRGVKGNESATVTTPTDLTYPVLSIYNATQQRRIEVAAFRAAQRLMLRFIHDEGYETQARRLLDLVAEGGAVARLCNRVDDAQGIFRALQRLAPRTGILIHARFPLKQRQSREKRIDRRVGRKTKRTPTDRVIIVGTQVLEQSLDYDVDVMVTDLAPIDLLLQRAGRLHRHKRDRLPQFCAAVMYVQYSQTDQGLPDWQRWKRIYDEYILWRTWQTLKNRAADGITQIMLPDGYRPLIEAVYTANLPPLDGEELYTAQMRTAWETMEQAQANMDGEARLRLTPHPLRRDSITRGDDLMFLEDEEGAVARWDAAKTRLGDRATAIPVYEIDGKWSLDPDGKQMLPKAPPPMQMQIALLNRALPISDPRLIDELRRSARWSWRSKTPALLEHVHPLELDVNGRTTIAGIPVRLDALLGLVINEEHV